jgi:ABC-2 type transport system permease protein
MMTNALALRAQTAAHCRSLWHQVRLAFGERRFATLTIAIFLGVYIWAAHALVSQGLRIVNQLPLAGIVLTERLLYLLFFFFFIMLILSNATITGIGLFRRQETQWLLTLPMPQESLVLWRTIEGLMLSSWGMILLSAPILAAFGKVFNAGAGFYLHSLPAVLCLIIIAANVSVWLVLVLVSFYRRWWWKVVGIGAVVLVWGMIQQFRDASIMKLAGGDIASSVNQILQHTRVCTHPLLPSTWVTEAVIATGKHQPGLSWYYHFTLLSYALMSWLVTAFLARRMFYSSWNRLVQRSFSTVMPGGATRADSGLRFGLRGLLRRLGVRRATLALIAKDGKTFVREPMQWGQCTLIFGLLLIYSWNLRHLGYNYTEPLWITIISYLNLTV